MGSIRLGRPSRNDRYLREAATRPTFRFGSGPSPSSPPAVIWAESEIGRISENHLTVRYAGETARLDREKLWRHWALWRGVTFVSSRSGAAASLLDPIWQDRWGRAASTFGGTCFRYAICAIASTGVRNARSISTATPSPVIVSLVGRFMIEPSMEKRANGDHRSPKPKDGQSFWQCAIGDFT
jgi:hypothetical protein